RDRVEAHDAEPGGTRFVDQLLRQGAADAETVRGGPDEQALHLAYARLDRAGGDHADHVPTVLGDPQPPGRRRVAARQGRPPATTGRAADSRCLQNSEGGPTGCGSSIRGSFDFM